VVTDEWDVNGVSFLKIAILFPKNSGARAGRKDHFPDAIVHFVGLESRPGSDTLRQQSFIMVENRYQINGV
jgi:hypothetical protein